MSSSTAVHLSQLEGADKIWHLRQASLLRGLSTRDLASVASICADQIYSKGQIIFDQGDPADAIFIVNRGCVRTSIVDVTGREKIVGLFQTGDVFGENLLSAAATRQVQAVAHEESWVSAISRADFLRLVSQRQMLSFNLIQILSEKLAEAHDSISELSFLDTERRVAKTLVRLSQIHGKCLADRKRMIKLKISLSHEQLARMIGGNRPHISTIMSKFKKNGWISYQGRRLLVDPKVLGQILQSGLQSEETRSVPS